MMMTTLNLHLPKTVRVVQNVPPANMLAKKKGYETSQAMVTSCNETL